MPLLPVHLAVALCGGVLLGLTTPVPAGAALAWLLSSALGAAVGAEPSPPVDGVHVRCGGRACCRSRARVRTPIVVLVAPRLPALLDQVHGGGVVTLRGVLEEDASPGVNGVRLRLAVQRFGDEEVDGAEVASLTVGGTLAEPQMARWRAGRTIQTSATLRRPAHYLNPGVGDDRLALARRGLTLVGSVKSGTLVEVQAPGTWRHERAAEVRAHVRATLATYVRPRDPTAAAIATAILIGDRTGLDPALEKRLQVAGTYHVIAISGGNIAVLTAILLGLTRLLRVAAWLGGPLVALLLVLHAGLVGGGSSVARATTMAVDLPGTAHIGPVGVEPQRAGRCRHRSRGGAAPRGSGSGIRAQRRRHGSHHRPRHTSERTTAGQRLAPDGSWCGGGIAGDRAGAAAVFGRASSTASPWPVCCSTWRRCR